MNRKDDSKNIINNLPMNNLEVNTSQNININFKLASLGDRILAALIDGLIVGAYFIIIFFGFLGLIDSGAIDGLQQSIPSEARVTVFAIFMIILILPMLLYHLLCEQFMNGQSFGKRAIGIKVVKEDSSQPSFGTYLIRWFLRIIDSVPSYGIAVVSILLTEKSQRLGDLAAGTIVIRLNEGKKTSDTLFFEFDENHQVVYDNVLKLKDRDIEVIKAVLNNSASANNRDILRKLSYKIAGIIEYNSQIDDYKGFLNQVMKDYNYKCIVED